MRIRVELLASMVLLVAACSQPAAAPKPDLAVEEKAIRDQDSKWLKAVESRDAAGEASVFAGDGAGYREHVNPLVGPAAYQAWAAKFYAENPKSRSSWTTDKIEFAEAGDLVIQTGEFHSTGLGPKGDGEDKGRFVTVWKKTNGEWKVAYDIGSTTMPETPPKK